MTLKDVAIVVTKNGMGSGPPELMKRLLERYLQILAEEPDPPRYVLLYSEGVQVARAGSPYVPALRTLEQKGVQLLLCGICVEYYGMQGQHPVGLNSCIGDIRHAQDLADKVVTL